MRKKLSSCDVFRSNRRRIIILYVILASILSASFTSLVHSQTSFGTFPKIIRTQSITIAVQEPVPEEEWLKPGIVSQATNFLYSIYAYLRKLVVYMLEQTIFKGQPGLASFYGEAATFLASITALYVILSLVTLARRVVMVVLIIGWVLFAVSIVIRAGIPT